LGPFELMDVDQVWDLYLTNKILKIEAEVIFRNPHGQMGESVELT